RHAKCASPKSLHRTRQARIRCITRLPEPITLREFFRCECCDSQQIVGSIFDHVDAQIISGIDAEIWPVRVAKSEPLQFDRPVERRMLDAFDFWNVHQAPESFFIKDFAIRREHWPQLEG